MSLNPLVTVTTRTRRRGERGISRKTIARGMPGLLRCTCGDYARVLLSHCTRGYGCIGHPAFPAPSDFLGERFLQSSGASRRGNAKVCVKFEPRHCEEQSDASRRCERSEAIHSQNNGDNGLLRRGACHRARIRATRWLLAMTASELAV